MKNTVSEKTATLTAGRRWSGRGLCEGTVGHQAISSAKASPYYKQKKPCRLLGGFSGEAGETTIATGDAALASESPVEKQSSQGGAL